MGLGVAKFGRTSVTSIRWCFRRRCVASAQSVTVLDRRATRKPTPLTGEIIGNFQRWLRAERRVSAAIRRCDVDASEFACGG
jgi:acyl-CoA thioester hydrolase